MSERPFQAADVYNATGDKALYDWVAGLERDRDTYWRLASKESELHVAAQAESTRYRKALERVTMCSSLLTAKGLADQALAPSRETER